jgi:cation diffusion facilitator family transporter
MATSEEADRLEDRLDGDAGYRLKRRVTVVGGIVNLFLAAGKVLVGVAGQSQALVVDGIHSLSDLVSDVLVLLAARFASHGPDDEHPYGHARFETAATVAVGVLLLIVAAGFTYDAMVRLLDPSRLLVPHWIVLLAALASVLVKEALYQYTARAGRRVGSKLIAANAWHHRSDALSSVVVIVGVLGTLAGLAWFDAAATVVVALMVGWVGAGFAWHALRELVDTGLSRSELAELQRHIETVDGVRAHHGLRTRRMGRDVLVDVHILVAPWLSVSEGHRIAEEVASALLERVRDAADVLVHVDVEPAHAPPRQQAPLRGHALAQLRDAWQSIPEAAAASRILLHYRQGGLYVEMLVPPGTVAAEQAEQLSARLERAAADLGYLREVRVMIGRGGTAA